MLPRKHCEPSSLVKLRKRRLLKGQCVTDLKGFLGIVGQWKIEIRRSKDGVKEDMKVIGVREEHAELLVRSAHQKTFNKVGVALLDFPEDLFLIFSKKCLQTDSMTLYSTCQMTRRWITPLVCFNHQAVTYN